MDSDVSSSSDKSFAWAYVRTSNDSDSSDFEINMQSRKDKIKEDANTSVSNKSYEYSTHGKKRKKLDSKSEFSDSENTIHSPKKKKIKVDELQDLPTSRKKSKENNQSHVNETLEYSGESTCDNKHESNMKVKPESDNDDITIVSKSKRTKKIYDDNDKKSKKSRSNRNKDPESVLSDENTNKIKYTNDIDTDYDFLNMKVKHEKDSSVAINVSQAKENKESDNNESISSINELDSTSDRKTKKKKSKSKNNKELKTASFLLNDSHNKMSDTDADYDFLFMKVKEEEEEDIVNESKSKIKKQHSMNNSVINGIDSTPNYKLKKEKKRKSKKPIDQDTESVISCEQKHDADCNLSEDNEFAIEDKFCAEETFVQKTIPHCSSSQENNKSNSTKNRDYESSNEQHEHGFDSYTQSDNNNLQGKDNRDEILGTNAKHKSLIQNTLKIKDRIQFEHSFDMNINVAQSNSKKLNQFLETNSSLQPVTKKLLKNQEITEDDEIWILKCPHDLDLVSFKDKDITIDNKSKMKINGESYNKFLDENVGSITVMSGEIMKILKMNGVVTLRKKLPKPHVLEEHKMVNNQTDFIPLPDIKCRHPLFGSDYKKSLKMPNSVVQRLNNSTGDLIIPTTKKKKMKLKKECEDLDIQPNLEIEHPKKKAKKRKHEKDSDFPVKKAKRTKKELDSSDVWESEKAIEENLFNF